MPKPKPDLKSEKAISDEFKVITSDLTAKLKECDPDVQQYIVYLKAEIKKLHKQNLHLQAKNESLNLRVETLEEHYTNCNECELKMIEKAEAVVARLERQSKQ